VRDLGADLAGVAVALAALVAAEARGRSPALAPRGGSGSSGSGITTV
jgi:hypothetical protein